MGVPGSSHILYSEGYADPGAALTLYTRGGILRARLIAGMIELDFPSSPPKPAGPPPRRNKNDYMVEIKDETVLGGIKLDFSCLNQVDAEGVIVTARSKRYDFISRVFAPRVGPVTGY